MKNRVLIILMTLLITCTLFSGCGDSEKKAKASFYEAQTLIRDGKEDEGKKLLNEVIAKYPETTVAAEANKVLNEMHATKTLTKILKEKTIEDYNRIARTDLIFAVTAQEGYFVDNETYTDSLDKLIGEFGLYLADGVTISVVAADSDKYIMKASHIRGDKTYIVSGPGGIMQEE